MFKTIMFFCLYWIAEIVLATVIYYCLCAVGVTVFPSWPGHLFWWAGLPVLLGASIAYCAIVLLIGSLIWLNDWNWRESKTDTYKDDEYRKYRI